MDMNLVEKVHEAVCVAKTECLQEGLSGLTGQVGVTCAVSAGIPLIDMGLL